MFESSETGRIFPFDLIGKFAISPIFRNQRRSSQRQRSGGRTAIPSINHHLLNIVTKIGNWKLVAVQCSLECFQQYYFPIPIPMSFYDS